MSSAAGGSAGVLERDAELARIEAAVARAPSGRGSLLVVEGPAGIGKSALIGAARAVSDAAGTRTLRARGGELERDFAFGVVRQLLEPALSEAPARIRDDLLQGPAGVAGRLLGLPGALPEGSEGQVAAPDASFTVLHGLYWLCANLAGDRPLVVTVDDAHWADAPSLRFLAFLLPRLEELSLALVVATRPEAEGAAAPLLGLLLADPLARVLRPAPLSASAVGRLIEEGRAACRPRSSPPRASARPAASPSSCASSSPPCTRRASSRRLPRPSASRRSAHAPSAGPCSCASAACPWSASNWRARWRSRHRRARPGGGPRRARRRAISETTIANGAIRTGLWASAIRLTKIADAARIPATASAGVCLSSSCEISTPYYSRTRARAVRR